MPTHEYERLARTALLEVTPDSTVGAFVDAVDEGDDTVSLRFANRMPGYPGWRWTVSVAKIGEDDPTVLEVELMPGDGSLVAPEWVPWSERLAEYRAAQESDGPEDDDEADDDEADDDESDDDDLDEDADYDDPDDDDADDDESDDDDDDFDADEDDLSESDDDDLDGVDVDELDDTADEDEPEPEPVAPPRARRRRAQRVHPVDPHEDLEVDRLDASEVDPDHHRS
ncbi:DUF3027 domain-containing protein [Curtobacterium sp. DN_7.5]|uniref:DUF3027 domain-containing protein n=1 Tax=Curtobacterium sp. DN_7.5 TaxID=3049047 RepID=UPI001F581FE4|nr:DUF3027 domain-containing protein [Curtobacterium sp. DN_7.5]